MIDVCFIVEGTYPYVAGGVSTWIHQLISSMKNVKFAIVHIASHSDPTRTVKYQVPNQVIYLKEIYLHDYQLWKSRNKKPRKEDFKLLEITFEEIIKGNHKSFADIVPLFTGKHQCLDAESILSSKETFEILNKFYNRYAKNISYLDFFWTWRNTHLPLLQIMQSDLPQARIYHAISTGYAGFVGALAKCTWGGKYLLTEHGIYTHERMLEVSQASWLFEPESEYFRPSSEFSFFKHWWINVFQTLSRISYDFADSIYTIYEGNKIKQIVDGAREEKISIIPNGIDLSYFSTIKRERRKTPHIGHVGRVVNIKDIKTFIQATKLILDDLPDAKFYIVGPTDEEPAYYEECKMLIEMLSMEDHITFTGRVDVRDYYSFFDLVVLTSLSEAQPYTIHEANSIGIPVVATDVGACREIIEGQEAEDRSLGKSGIITDVGSPEATANAIVELIKNKQLYNRCAESGIKRVKKFYDKDDMVSRYLNVYEKVL